MAVAGAACTVPEGIAVGDSAAASAVVAGAGGTGGAGTGADGACGYEHY